MQTSRTNLIIYSASAAAGIALFLVLLLAVSVENWLFWVLAGVGAAVLCMLLANVVLGYIAAGKDEGE